MRVRARTPVMRADKEKLSFYLGELNRKKNFLLLVLDSSRLRKEVGAGQVCFIGGESSLCANGLTWNYTRVIKDNLVSVSRCNLQRTIPREK